MDIHLKLKSRSQCEEFITNMPLLGYDIIEFSYGGFNVDYFIQHMFNYDDDMQPTSMYYWLFNRRNFNTKKYVGVSAGAIFLGLVLLDRVSGHTILHEIRDIVKWFRTYIDKNPRFYYYSLGTTQKEVLSIIQKCIPKDLLDLTIRQVAEKLDLCYHPGFIYFDLPNKIVECGPDTTVYDAMYKSSDVFGIKDGGFSQTFPGYQPLYDVPNALVLSISPCYKSVCVHYDIIHLK